MGRGCDGKVEKKSWCGLQDKATSGKSTTRATWPSMDINVATAVVLSSSCQDDGSRTSCHGDDFAKTGEDDAVNSSEPVLKKRYSFKRLAVWKIEAGVRKQAVFLNRVLTVDTKTQPWMVVWELDSRDAKLLIRALRLEKATGAETPAEHRSADRQSVESKSNPLSAEFNTKFGSCVRRAAPLAQAQDDPTISETVTQLSRRLRAPHEMDYQMLKWEGISGGTPRRRTRSRYGACSTKIRVHAGTDHVGCAVTQRSTAVLCTVLDTV